MEPRVTRREKKLFLTYNLDSRIRCSAILPQTAPNGATIILYGHGQGLKAVWRGGRRLRRPRVNRSSQQDTDMDELDGAQPPDTQAANYEDEEEELDADCPYPSMPYTLDMDLGSSVTKIAVPSPSIAPRHSPKNQHATVIVATLDGQISLLQIPLAPPSADKSKSMAASVVRKAIQLKLQGDYVKSLSAKFLGEASTKVIVAAWSHDLLVWELSTESKNPANLPHTVIPYGGMPTSITFHPAPRSREFMIAKRFGSVRVCEAPISEDTTTETSNSWLYTLATPFHARNESSPAVSVRKQLLDASFILGGRCILALLDDGQWGVWDMTASKADKNHEQFVLSGYLESAVAGDVAESAVAKKITSGLTPMTPNTRKVKSTDFFTASQPRSEHSAATGGICVSRTSSAAGVTDESVMIWHNNEIYSIPSIQSFWQRSTSGSGGLGTLYAPGIARVPGVNLFNETITSISQFTAGSTASDIGQLKIQRDFLVSAEHRFIIVQNRPGTTNGFTQALAKAANSKDQHMLDAGDLDLGGMDRILSNMDGRSRKVGFAQ